MPRNSLKNSVVAVCTLGACFVVGFGGAHGGSILETRSAVAQARAAATAVSAEAHALEHSVMRAQASIRASAFAADEQAVAAAAADVEQATAVDVAVDVAGEDTIARVLDGNIDTSAAAHDATERLEEARQDIDQARAAIDDEVRELDQARAAVKHQERLQQLGAVLERTPTHIASVTSALEQVGVNVTEPKNLSDTSDAIATLESAIATARHVDRADPQQVTYRLDAVAAAHARLDSRLVDLTQSHQEWVQEHNADITARNDTVLAAHDTAIEEAREQHILANRAQVAAFSNGWSGQPEGVSGANGRLAWDSLCEIEFAPQHRLQCDAAASLAAADAQYFADTGKHLVLTDSYRSYSLQVRTRALKPRTAARAGSSNHGWGMAIDMDRESALWLTENGADYGWVHPDWAGPGGARPEWWHLEYVATSVGAFEAPAPLGLTELVVSVFDAETEPRPDEPSKAQPTSANVTTE